MFTPTWKHPKTLFGLYHSDDPRQHSSAMFGLYQSSDMGEMISARHRGHTRPRGIPHHPGWVSVVIRWEGNVPEPERERIRRKYKLIPIGGEAGNIEQHQAIAAKDPIAMNVALDNELAIREVSVAPSWQSGFNVPMLFGLPHARHPRHKEVYGHRYGRRRPPGFYRGTEAGHFHPMR